MCNPKLVALQMEKEEEEEVISIFVDLTQVNHV